MTNIDAEIYSGFKCKADKCNHSCCKGWEIDIDEDTLGYYKSLDTKLLIRDVPFLGIMDYAG